MQDLTLDDLWPCCMTFDHMNIWRFPYYVYAAAVVQWGFENPVGLSRALQKS